MREGQAPSCLHSDDLRSLIADRLADFEVIRHGDVAGLKRAAVAIVVVPLDLTGGEACFLLTARAAKLRAHGGQLALPGGRMEPGETIEETALRELHEELGIRLHRTAIIGSLDDYRTRSGYLISPVVVWHSSTEVTPNQEEVQKVFRIPLAELLRGDAPEVFAIRESERPVIRLLLPSLGGHVNAPTAALLYQFREVALGGRPTRVAHFDQPVWAWR